MKNKAIDLHNILFEQLERLNDLDEADMKSGKLQNEIQRTEAMSKVAMQIISNGRMVLDAIRTSIDFPDEMEMPEMLKIPNSRALLGPGAKKRNVKTA